MGGACTSSTGPPVLHGSILRVQGQGTGTWEQRTTAPWSALHASGLQAFSLLSSFPHSCHHLPHLFHPTTLKWLTWAARIPAQGPAEWGTQRECLQLFWLVTWNMDKLGQLQVTGLGRTLSAADPAAVQPSRPTHRREQPSLRLFLHSNHHVHHLSSLGLLFMLFSLPKGARTPVCCSSSSQLPSPTLCLSLTLTLDYVCPQPSFLAIPLMCTQALCL